MLELMISELFSDYSMPVLISRLELDRNKPTTTYETDMELKLKFPNHEFYFVVGSDLLGDIKTKWIHGEELFKNTNFIAVKKPNVSPPSNLPPHFTWLDDIDWVDVSSTLIRKLISEGSSGTPYLSPKVSDYIKKHKLYLTP